MLASMHTPHTQARQERAAFLLALAIVATGAVIGIWHEVPWLLFPAALVAALAVLALLARSLPRDDDPQEEEGPAS